MIEGEKRYHIEDGIKLPISSNDSNPEEVYKILDKDKREDKLKFSNIKLYPSCIGGLLSCQYYIKILIETNTLFSTNEYTIIPIDFYSPFIKEKEEEKLMSKSINIKFSKSFKLKSGEKIFGEKINMDKLEPKDNLKDNEDIIEKYFKIKKENFFNKDFDSNQEKEKKEEKSEPKDKEDKKNDEDDDNNFEGFEILPKYY